MSDDTLRERINREFERESDALERRLQERQIADPELAAMKMPDDSFDDLMRRIAAEQKETESVSMENTDRKFSKKPFRIRKRVLLSVAAAAVLAVAMGVGATGAKLFVPKVENSSEDGEFNTRIISGEIEEDRDITEEEAYEEIENRIGIQALRLGYKPEGMELEKVYIDGNMYESQMEFSFKDSMLIVYENKQNDEAIFEKKLDGKEIDVVDVFYMNKILKIVQIDKGDETYFYATEIEYGNAYYYISTDLELAIFKELLEEIYFKNV
ncbi:hypothetical protein ACTNCH_04325 [Candidatus Merdisoma sp. HCP28S3_D10]|uniref:hypothetical protein n=1 Tax=unclassified Candidatus Merdisoma TaxID=3099611 RepID=UPI003F894DE0